MSSKTAQIISAVLQVLGALPLIVYPFVLLANIMSAAAKPNPNAPRRLRAVVRTFLVGTTTYPVVFLQCLFGARRAWDAARWNGDWPSAACRSSRSRPCAASWPSGSGWERNRLGKK